MSAIWNELVSGLVFPHGSILGSQYILRSEKYPLRAGNV